MTKKKAIDKIDLNILSIMQGDARITNHDLSSRINLSPSSCLQRVKRLEEEGYLTGYLANINLDKVCRTVTVLATVSLHDHRSDNFRKFEKAIKKFPEIVECYTVSGNFDYFLRIVCPDMSHYLRLSDVLVNDMEGNANVSSHVVLDCPKPFKGYAIESLVE